MIYLAAALLVLQSPTVDRPTVPHAGSQSRATVHLRGLDQADAEKVIVKLEKAQAQLRRGPFQTFKLLSGGVASGRMTRVTPRQTFLAMDFRKARIIERFNDGNKLWKRHSFAFQVHKPNHELWVVEVVLGFYDQIERVELFYGPPPPF